MDISFPEFLRLMEERGWRFTRIWKPYRVFTRPGRLPVLVELHRGKVLWPDVERVKRIIEEAEGGGPSDGGDAPG